MLTPSAERLRSRVPPPSAVAGHTFNSLALKPLHLNTLQYYQNGYYNAEEEKKEEKEEERNKEKRGSALIRRNPDNNNVQHHAQVNHLAFHEANSQKARQLTSENNEKHRKQYLYGLPDVGQGNHHSPHQVDQRSVHPHRQQQQQQRQQTQPPNSAATVVPQNRIATKSHRVAERMKDSRLNGADLYVARLGRAGKVNHHDCGCHLDRSISRVADAPAFVNVDGEQEAVDMGASSKAKPLTGSLHEELRFQSPVEESKSSVQQNARLTATHSRPCYRCISYMHSAGIKRVFWTNYRGEWEGGKVRELVDALECPNPSTGEVSTGQSAPGSVYVTKTEVLLLKGLK
ncbi:MAG: hypothetical protein LQ346_005153 [Caloplaca aetnensis]|nr:MAG: hypothetical protein LQ346_005153 [Caloplaca aetnensis]